MLIGAIGAILYYQRQVLFLKLTNNWIAQFSSWLIILLVAINKFHLASFIDNELISIVSVFLIVGQIEKDKRLINLNNPFLDFVGKISYGVYVIHPLIIFYLSKTISLSNERNVYGYILVYGAVFTTTIFIAYISYAFFERRFLADKDKYSKIMSSNSMYGGAAKASRGLLVNQ